MGKWLYRFVRLFICPHKYVFQDQIKIEGSKPDVLTGYIVLYECCRCGKFKQYKITA